MQSRSAKRFLKCLANSLYSASACVFLNSTLSVERIQANVPVLGSSASRRTDRSAFVCIPFFKSSMHGYRGAFAVAV